MCVRGDSGSVCGICGHTIHGIMGNLDFPTKFQTSQVERMNYSIADEFLANWTYIGFLGGEESHSTLKLTDVCKINNNPLTFCKAFATNPRVSLQKWSASLPKHEQYT